MSLKRSETGRIILKLIVRKQSVVIWSTTTCALVSGVMKTKAGKFSLYERMFPFQGTALCEFRIFGIKPNPIGKSV
jgi:hypothetical protein